MAKKKPSHPFNRSVKPQARHDAEAERKFDIDVVERQLKPMLVSIVERAFRRYCNAHGAAKIVEDLEWTRFKKILNGML